MQTSFSDAQRRRPEIRVSEAILRKCVHCGFCTATCPTYLIAGDELDGPRGRIYLIKDMLENDRPATPDVVRHIDRCLSCLGCMTTCPSGVDYQHLVDHARVHIESTYRRPWRDRLMRDLLAAVMPYPARFRRLLMLARWLKPLARIMPPRIAAALSLVPRRMPPAGDDDAGGSAGAQRRAETRARVGVMTGCVQAVLGRAANTATFRLLERAGVETVEISGCCGSLTHHLGRADNTRRFAASFIGAIEQHDARAPLDAIVVNASGCGTHLKDYGFVFRGDADLAASAATVTQRARDITEYLAEIGLPPTVGGQGLRVAYHSACSMQHGQHIDAPPRDLLRQAGFDVIEIPDGHLCCGSAGSYNMLQPEFARALADRKLASINALDVDVIAAGNLGCLTQIGAGARYPVVHTVELLDWATGGPRPAAIEDRR